MPMYGGGDYIESRRNGLSFSGGCYVFMPDDVLRLCILALCLAAFIYQAVQSSWNISDLPCLSKPHISTLNPPWNRDGVISDSHIASDAVFHKTTSRPWTRCQRLQLRGVSPERNTFKVS